MKDKCKRGHPTVLPSDRTTNGACRECHRLTMIEYRKAHPQVNTKRYVKDGSATKHFLETNGLTLSTADAREERLEAARERAEARRQARDVSD